MASMNVCVGRGRHKSNNITNLGLLCYIETVLPVMTSNLFIFKSGNLCLFLILGDCFVISPHSHCREEYATSSVPLFPAFLMVPIRGFLLLEPLPLPVPKHCFLTFAYLSDYFLCLSNLTGYLGRESYITSNFCTHILRRTPLTFI